MRYEQQWGHKVASREGPVEVTRLEYNEQAGAETPAQPDIPVCAEHVWIWWHELNARRVPGFDSPVPLTYGEIDCWIRLTEKVVDVVEMRWLIEMDDAWLGQMAEERQARREREEGESKRKGSK